MSKPLLAAFALLLLAASPATAAPGVAKGNVNLRTGPGTGYARIAIVPAGARVDILRCAGWCEIIHAGRRGWVSGSYVARAARSVPRGGYAVLPDKSMCHGPQAWTLPYCESPIERSVRDFNQSTSEFARRQDRRR